MRRELHFKSFEDALVEVDDLLSGEVETLGTWSFFQILDHCAGALRFSMAGHPVPPRSLVERARGWLLLRLTFLRGSIPAGIRNPRIPDGRIEGDAREAAVRLREAASAFRAHQGSLTPHPRFGPLSKAEWEKMHLFHLANHLGFARRKP